MNLQETAPCHAQIDKLEVTHDTLTGRGGLAFFVKYVEAIGIVALLLNKFAGLKKSTKGVTLRHLFLQTLYFFFDGTAGTCVISTSCSGRRATGRLCSCPPSKWPLLMP